MGGRYWTAADDERLRELTRAGWRHRRIAAEMGRSAEAVQIRAARLGELARDHGAPRWTAAELATLRAGVTAGRRVADLARELGRPLAATFVRLGKIGARRQPHWCHADEAKLYRGMVLVDDPGLQAAARLTDRSVHACRARWKSHFVRTGIAPGSPAPRGAGGEVWGYGFQERASKTPSVSTTGISTIAHQGAGRCFAIEKKMLRMSKVACSASAQVRLETPSGVRASSIICHS